MTALPIHTTFKDRSMQQASVKIQTFIIIIIFDLIQFRFYIGG